MLKSKVFDRLDLSAEFYDQYNCRNEKFKRTSDFLMLKISIMQM